MTDAGLAVAAMALEAGAIQLNLSRPFTWASGYRMPVYNDNRLLLSDARFRRGVAEAFAAVLKQDGVACDLLAGTATAGIPHATSLADLCGLPLIYVRDKPKEHGLGNQIEGLKPGQGLAGRNVVLIEDLISTGSSALKAVQAIRAAGGSCVLCLAIMTYDFKEAALAFEGLKPACRMRTLLSVEKLIPLVLQAGGLKPEELESLRDWESDPFGWGERHGFPRVKK